MADEVTDRLRAFAGPQQFMPEPPKDESHPPVESADDKLIRETREQTERNKQFNVKESQDRMNLGGPKGEGSPLDDWQADLRLKGHSWQAIHEATAYMRQKALDAGHPESAVNEAFGISDPQPAADRMWAISHLLGMANMWAKAGVDAIQEPAHAAQRLIERGVVHPSDIDSSFVRDALLAGPGALVAGIGRAWGIMNFGTKLATLGVAGGTQVPKLTALIDTLRGTPEFEALAQKYYNALKAEQAATLSPAMREAEKLAAGTPEAGLATRAGRAATDPLGEAAERAAAWDIYERQLGTSDFELGALGGGKGSAQRILTAQQREDIIKGAILTPDKPAKEIIRAFRAAHGEENVKDAYLVAYISRLRNEEVGRMPGAPTPGARTASARNEMQRILSDPAVEKLIADEWAAGSFPAPITTKVKHALGMAYGDPTITQSAVERKIKELIARRGEPGEAGAGGLPTPMHMPDDQKRDALKEEGYSDERIKMMVPEPVINPFEAFKEGLQASSGGAIATGRLPDKMLPQDADYATRLAHMAGVAIGDIPAMIAGAIGGAAFGEAAGVAAAPMTGGASIALGPVIGAGAGAFGLPAAIKESYVQALSKGQIEGPRDFAMRQAAIWWATTKGLITGGVTAGAGVSNALVRSGAGVVETALAKTSAELVAMVTIGKGLEGELPTAMDFADGAILLAAFKTGSIIADRGVSAIKANLHQEWVSTGVHPRELADRATTDPVFRVRMVADPVPPELPGSSETPTGEGSGNFVLGKDEHIVDPPQRLPTKIEKLSERIEIYEQTIPELPEGPLRTSMESTLAEMKKREENYHKEYAKLGRIPEEADKILRDFGGDFELGVFGGRGRIKPPASPPGLPPGTPPPVVPGGRGSWDYIASRMGDLADAPNLWQRLKDARHRIYLELFNPADPLRVLTDAIEAGGPLTVAQNPKFLNRLAELAPSRGIYWVERGMTEYYPASGTTRPSGVPGLNQILDRFVQPSFLQRTLPGGRRKTSELTDFWSYAISKWAIEKAYQAKETGVHIDHAMEVIVQGEKKYQRSFQDLMDWRNGTLEYLKDTRILSEELFEKLVAENTAGIPGYRWEDQAAPVKGAGPGKVTYNPVKTFYGSDLKIENLMKSLMQDGMLRSELGARNAMKLAAADGAEPLDLAKKIPTRMKKITLTQAEINEASAYNPTDPNSKVPEIWRALKADMNSKDVIMFRDGKVERWEFEDKELTSYLLGMDNTSLSTLGRIAAQMTRFTRGMIVMQPLFPVRIAGYDVPWQFIIKPEMRNTAWEFFRGIGHILKNGATYDRWLAQGAGERVFQGLSRDPYIKARLKGETDPAYLDGVWNVIRTPFHAMRGWAQLLSQAQPVGRFARGLEAGESQMTAAMAASEAKFHRADFGGPVSKSVNSVMPFTAAYLNSLEQTFRALTGSGKTFAGQQFSAAHTWIAATALITMPLVYQWATYKDEDWYKAAPDWQKDNGLFLPAALGHAFYKYPPVLSLIFGAIPRRLAEHFFEENPHAFDGFVKTIGASFLPPGGLITYNLAVPAIEHVANHSFFRDQPLVSDEVKRSRLPFAQSMPFSSETAKWLSTVLSDLPLVRDMNLSPPVIDNYIAGWGGTLGEGVVRTLDYGLQKAGIARQDKPALHWNELPGIRSWSSRYPSASAAPIRKFAERLAYYDQLHGALTEMWKEGNLPKFQQLVRDNPVGTALHTFNPTGMAGYIMSTDPQKTEFVDALKWAASKENIAAIKQVLLVKDAIHNLREVALAIGATETPQRRTLIETKGIASGIPEDQRLTPNDKRQLLDRLYAHMQVIAQSGNSYMDKAKLR